MALEVFPSTLEEAATQSWMFCVVESQHVAFDTLQWRSGKSFTEEFLLWEAKRWGSGFGWCKGWFPCSSNCPIWYSWLCSAKLESAHCKVCTPSKRYPFNQASSTLWETFLVKFVEILFWWVLCMLRMRECPAFLVELLSNLR